MWVAGALRGLPASTTRTLRRARDSTKAADKPAAPPPMTMTSYRFMSQGWRRAAGSPTNVAVSGKSESDEPGGRHFGGENCRRPRAGRPPAQTNPHPTRDDPDRRVNLDRDLEKHTVAARDRSAAAHPGTPACALPRLSGAAGRPRCGTRGRRPATAAQAWARQGQDGDPVDPATGWDAGLEDHPPHQQRDSGTALP